jgi:quinol monooxygenase YgiN
MTDMGPIRVLHQLRTDRGDDELASYASEAGAYPGCVESECYRSTRDRETVAVVQLWRGEDAFSAYWAELLGAAGNDLVIGRVGASGAPASTTEFYRHQYFDLDRIWIASTYASQASRINWPAYGAVRIIIQDSLAEFDAELPDLHANTNETHREPGCLQFEYFRGAQYEGHSLLLELWESQQIYDAHWHLRIKTRRPVTRKKAPRESGKNGREFYRHAGFRHLYDRWLPASVDQWSETVTWSA